MSPSATPATRSAAASTKRAAQCLKCHACHAKRWMCVCQRLVYERKCVKDGSVTSVVCISQVEPFAVFHGTKGFGPVWGFVPLHHVVLVVAMPHVLFFALQTPLMALCGASSPLVAGDAVTLCVAVTSITWQAWYNRTSTFISRGQAWHNLRSTFVLRGRPGTLSTVARLIAVRRL